jgi:hypothetical protein
MRLPSPKSVEESPTNKTIASRPIHLTLTAGGKLEVAVFENGQPLPHAAVNLSPFQNSFDLNCPIQEDAKETIINKVLYPHACADARGVARFADLAPGMYRILAGEYLGTNGWRPGVAIHGGESRAFQIAVCQIPKRRRMQILQSNGDPLVEGTGLLELGDNVFLNTNLDEQGMVELPQGGSGLYTFGYRYLDPLQSHPRLLDAPDYQAEALLATSPLLHNSPPLRLTPNRQKTPSMVVYLQDASGKPARGHVLIDRNIRSIRYAASTDAQGTVRFDAMCPGKVLIEAFLEGQRLPDLGMDSGPLPPDHALVGRSVLFRQNVDLVMDATPRVVLRPRPVGYVRGVVRPAPGRRNSDYDVTWQSSGELFEDSVHYNQETGEFVAGPFPEGKVTLKVGSWLPGLGHALCASQEVEIRSRRVARVELTALDARDALRMARRVLPSDSLSLGLADQLPMAGRVFLPDGRTPALGAELALYLPNSWSGVGVGEVDEEGCPHLWQFVPDKECDRRPPGSPTGPVVVARLPGRHGCVILPVQSDPKTGASFIQGALPPPLHLHGKVTVAGKPLAQRGNQFQVRAAYEGKGKLNEFLSQTVAVQADGSFELPALTPGTYSIQAAMDGIWLSTSLHRTVAPNGDLKPLALDIGAPGRASSIRLVNDRGLPGAGVRVTLMRPEGPLADSLWPRHFLSDGAGVVHLPPLEVGVHSLRIRGESRERTFTVPALTGADDPPVELRFVMD